MTIFAWLAAKASRSYSECCCKVSRYACCSFNFSQRARNIFGFDHLMLFLLPSYSQLGIALYQSRDRNSLVVQFDPC